MLDGLALARLVEHCHRDSGVIKAVKSTLFSRLEGFTFREIAELVYELARHNMRDEGLFRAIELEVYERKLPFDLPLLYKFLWAYTHLDAGSSMLYSKVCSLLKKGQHELLEGDLLRFCHLLSKVRSQSKGNGFMYELLEQKLTGHLHKKGFGELVAVAEVILAQNLCSNSLQLEL